MCNISSKVYAIYHLFIVLQSTFIYSLLHKHFNRLGTMAEKTTRALQLVTNCDQLKMIKNLITDLSDSVGWAWMLCTSSSSDRDLCSMTRENSTHKCNSSLKRMVLDNVSEKEAFRATDLKKQWSQTALGGRGCYAHHQALIGICVQ
jgi:hypothetical protein